MLKLASDLRQYRFDAAILLQNAFEAAFIAWMAGIPLRAGFKRDGRGLLLTHGVSLTPEIRARHQVHYYQMMLAGLGLLIFFVRFAEPVHRAHRAPYQENYSEQQLLDQLTATNLDARIAFFRHNVRRGIARRVARKRV